MRLLAFFLLVATTANAQLAHQCDGIWCKPGHFLGLDVSGTVSATHFIGDGSGLSGITGPSGTQPAGGPTSAVQFNGGGNAFAGTTGLTFISNTNTLNVAGTVNSGFFVGDGSGLTNVPSSGSSSPSSPLTGIQYNNSGVFGATSNFVFINSTNRVSLTGSLSATTIWGGRYQALVRTGIPGPASNSLVIGDRIISGTTLVQTFADGGVSATIGSQIVFQLTSQTGVVSGSLQANRYKANVISGIPAPQ